MRVEMTAKTVLEAVDLALEKLETTIDEVDYEIIQEPSNGFFGIGKKDAVVKVWTINDNEERSITKSNEPRKQAKAEKSESRAVENSNVQAAAVENINENNKKANEENKIEKSEQVEAAETLREPSPDFSPEAEAKRFLNEVFSTISLDIEVEANLKDNKQLNINLKGKDMGIIIGKRGQTLDALQYLVNLVINKGTAPYISVNLDTEQYRERRKETLENLSINLAKKAKHLKKNIVLEPMNPYERRIIHSTLQNDRYVTTYSEGEEPYRYVVISPKKNQ